jgi:hypothetical protein
LRGKAAKGELEGKIPSVIAMEILEERFQENPKAVTQLQIDEDFLNALIEFLTALIPLLLLIFGI